LPTDRNNPTDDFDFGFTVSDFRIDFISILFCQRIETTQRMILILDLLFRILELISFQYFFANGSKQPNG